MSRIQEPSSNVPDAGKLTENEKSELTDSRADSGFISSGNLMLSQEISQEILPDQLPYPSSHQADSGIIEDSDKKTGSSMHIDSGVYVTNELSLSEKISKLNLELNDLNQAKVVAPSPVEPKKTADDVPWQIYFKQDEDGNTDLHKAILHRFAEVALALIRVAPHPSLLDTRNDASQTPLHLAIGTEQYLVARWLIIAGARPCPRSSEGNSPLHLAVKLGNLNCVKAITDPVSFKSREALALSYKSIPCEKPNLEQWNYDGQTCVHVAAISGHLDVLKHLVSCGADINAREGLAGCTALHYAVENGDEKMVKFLLTECSLLNPHITSYRQHNAWQMSSIVSGTIRQSLRNLGVESPYSSEDENEEDSDDEEMFENRQVHRFSLNLVNASA
ncbi:NF-kappa-B inhibitor cactus [Euwallacea similis]|uniref:NF-kappa-B inhibitor cactus n=1 Tax=Euwallacea similis TaxID=1736056 RepID=UPI00344FF763